MLMSELIETLATGSPSRASRMSPEARRTHLVEIALKVFAQQGISAANHSIVAREAGVAVPTMFHYFATKEILIDEVLCEISRYFLKELLSGNDNAKIRAPESIEAILLSFADSIDSKPDYARVWMEWSTSIRGGLWDSYLVFHRDAISGIRKVLKRGVREKSIRKTLNVVDAARVIVGLAHMVAQMKFSGATHKQISQTVHSLVSGYLS